LLGKREPAPAYRTVDGGHPAPYPDMTDEQLYNYEMTFKVPNRTFDAPPRPAKPARAPREGTTIKREPAARTERNPQQGATPKAEQKTERVQTVPHEKKPGMPQPPVQADPPKPLQLPPLDLSKPVRLITTKQPVEIITTRARHPVYKVHAYIGDDDVVTLFTIDGRLSESGPRYLENVPQRQQLYLNIYPNPDAGNGNRNDRFVLTQHGTKQEAEAAAKPERIVCVMVQFEL
jgi:hypothetical protein